MDIIGSVRIGKLWIFVPVVILLLAECSSRKRKIEKLADFDAEAWISDKNGCDGNRLILKEALLASKHYMRGLKAEQIEDYLGKPDAQELFSRSQRYYIYFIEPGPKCENSTESAQALFVRFSAVGIANEFTIKPL